MKERICKICSNSTNNTIYTAKEMMFGLLDEFEYIECSNCGCLQIVDIPENIFKYYPSDYYSYSVPPENIIKKELKFFIQKQIVKFRIGYKNLAGLTLSKYINSYYWLYNGLCNFDSKILDVGCGNGSLLLELKRIGFKKLTGIDPYIDKDIHYKNGVSVLKKEIGDINEKFDFIMLHHSFEHMDNPQIILKKINQCLDTGAIVLIRIPIASSYAYQKYGTNWVQLDAPRHLFLHTHESIRMISEETGFKIIKTLNDSTDFQFWGSEKYKINKSLFEKHEFSHAEKKMFKREAKRLNDSNMGDSACFYLKKLL